MPARSSAAPARGAFSLVFSRGDAVFLVNARGEPLPLDGALLLASEPLVLTLPPGAAAWTR